MIATLCICGAILLWIAVVVFRALMFRPEKISESVTEEIFVDSQRVSESLAEMIRCKTVSDVNKKNEDEREFQKFRELLPGLFPNIYRKCEIHDPGDRSILLRWCGRSDSAPTVLMAHYDVVSVNEDAWDFGAFDGVVTNEFIIGRGSIDTKATLNGIMCAVDQLISEGFVPENDVYMAFGGDEEINGHGAVDNVSYFRDRNITPALVLDEGGAVVDNVFPGVEVPAALIGIGEKGMLNVEYTVNGGGGHSSSPERHTPVGKLSRACVRMENSPFKFRITPPAAEMFRALARHSNFFYRVIFANLWCFAPVLNFITRRSGGEFSALVRTTTAFTQMEGSRGMNVIPPRARMVSNHRIIPGETVDSVTGRIRKKIKDKDVEINVINGVNPSRVSTTDCEGWDRLRTATKETWSDAVVSPYLMLACSDSRHFGEISDKVYRFSAMALSNQERALIHGNNEMIPIETAVKTVEFYIRLIKKC